MDFERAERSSAASKLESRAQITPRGRTMKTLVLVTSATAFLLLANTSSRVFAAPSEQPNTHQTLSADDKAAFLDARVAALKAGLRLSPAQEKTWAALETTLRDVTNARAARIAEWRKTGDDRLQHPDTIERLRRGAKRLTYRGADLEKVADAAKPLYDTLDDGQKRRFGPLLRTLLAPHWRHGGWSGSSDHASDPHESGHGG
jgi:hypothetical protein